MRKFLSTVLFIFIALPLTLSSMMLISTRPWALDRATYKRFVEDDRLYAALRAPEIAARAPETLKIGPASFEGPALVAALQKDLPFPEIKTAASKAVDTVMDAVQSPAGASGRRVEFDLRSLKAALKLKSPAVARDYVAGLSKTGDAPGDLSQPEAISKALSTAVDSIPDRAVSPVASNARRLGGPLGMPMGVLTRAERGELETRGLSQALLNRMTATMAAASSLLLAGLGALGGSSALSRLSRAGRFLMVPSVIVLGIGVVLAIPGGLILQNVLPHDLQGMVGGAAGAQLRAYLASVLGPIARSFFITGLVGASLGGVLSQARRMGDQKELE